MTVSSAGLAGADTGYAVGIAGAATSCDILRLLIALVGCSIAGRAGALNLLAATAVSC